MGEMLMWTSIAVAGLVAALAGALLAAYLRSYQKIHAPFTLGLAVFAGTFLVQGLFLAYGDWIMIPFFEGPLAPFLLGLSVLEAVALGPLVYITYR